MAFKAVTSSPCVSSPNRLGELFSACDLDGSGFIDESELASFCTDLSADEVADVFRELDKDGDGRISITEFSEGFKEFTDQLTSLSQLKRKDRLVSSLSSDGDRQGELRRRRASSCEDYGGDLDAESTRDFLLSLDDDFTILSSQEHVCELYQSIHNVQIPHLTTLFENVLLSVIRDIKQHQYEKERLERSYKRDKEQHARHLRQLEEEMEVQMAKVESRVKEEEKERHEAEKEELRSELECEIAELRKNVQKLQKLEEETVASTPSDEMKHRVEELLTENRQLRSSVTDSATNLALAKSECATSRQQFEEKCYELETEKETLLDYIREQENLTRQVHLLQDANKKLHDTNDDLRAALDSSRSAQKRSHAGTAGSLARLRNVDFVSDYLDSSRNMQLRMCMQQGATLADELNMTLEPRRQCLLPRQETCEIDSLPDDLDSGHSTLRDLPDLDSEYEPISMEEDHVFPIPRKRNRPLAGSEFGSTTESEVKYALPSESQDEMDTEVDVVGGDESLDDAHDDVDGPHLAHASGSCQVHPAERHVISPMSSSRPSSASSRRSTYSQASSGSLKRQATVRRRPPLVVQKPITKEPERMYKVVLAGDAAVGKSSFIMRLCKGKFVNNISSTLGVDFQTKVIEVDGRVVALQLWDTAGQERFRSIAKSYFRRADGVLLLYDCTYERSFMNVRDWVEAIEDGAPKKIPVMFCANKTDLRDQLTAGTDSEKRRVVKTEDGYRLAKEYDGLFIETSAKENSNVLEAVTELARMLRTNEDIEVKSVNGLQLQEMANSPKRGFRCCKT